jgi:hypothetical protein
MWVKCCAYAVRPRESGDPGRQIVESEQVALGSRFRGNERFGRLCTYLQML